MKITALRRTVIYIAVLVVSLAAAIAIVAGFITQEQVGAVVTLTVTLFGSIGSILALLNITPDE